MSPAARIEGRSPGERIAAGVLFLLLLFFFVMCGPQQVSPRGTPIPPCAPDLGCSCADGGSATACFCALDGGTCWRPR